HLIADFLGHGAALRQCLAPVKRKKNPGTCLAKKISVADIAARFSKGTCDERNRTRWRSTFQQISTTLSKSGPPLGHLESALTRNMSVAVNQISEEGNPFPGAYL